MEGKQEMVHDESIRLRLKGDELTFLTSIGGGEDQSVIVSVSSIRDDLEKRGLTEAGLENVITQVEDLIMPILRALPATTKLEVYGSVLEKVFNLLSTSNDVGVSIETVESLFSQLAGYAVGSPAAWRQAVSPHEVTMGLVILREVMHHGRFGSVTLWIVE